MTIAPKINLFLLFIIAVEVVFIWQMQQPQANNPILASYDVANINRITIIPPNADAMVLKKAYGRWTLASLQHFPANPDVVAQLLALGQAEILSHYPLPQDLASFGLNPGIVIKLNDHALKLGKLDALKQQRYVQVEDQLYLIFDRYSHHLKTSLMSVELTPKRTEITSIHLPKIKLRLQEGEWKAMPDMGQAEIKTLVDLWSNAQAQRVSLRTQATQQSNVTLHFEDQSSTQFWFDEQRSTLTRQSPPIQYVLSEALTQQLFMP